MLPGAYIVHRIRGRMRLRIRQKRGDRDYFEAVQRGLETLPGIEEVRINPVTGTVLLLHPDESCDRVLDRLRQWDLFELMDCDEPVVPVLAPLSSGLSLIDKTLSDSSGGRLDLRSVAYIALMGVTVAQLVRGQVLGPALPMAWQALSLLDRINGWKQAASSGVADAGDAVDGDSGD
jgi:hypothetical protein